MLPDSQDRDDAVAERARNVVVDAGAGTGKTSLLVKRLLAMLAPTDGAPAIPIGRVAAITFTRKAAGELRLRIRERLLEALGQAPGDAARVSRLREALAGLDTACIGTIHSFADRLLRLHPVEARLSPSYDIAEDDETLVRETFHILLQASDGGTLDHELQGTAAAAWAREAAQTVADAIHGGVPAETREWQGIVTAGLDALVGGFIRQRDVPPTLSEVGNVDLTAFRAVAAEFIEAARPLGPGSPGSAWLVRLRGRLERLLDSADAQELFEAVSLEMRHAPKSGATKKDDFAGDEAAWKLWKRFTKDDPPMRQRLLAPLHAWMARRLVRLFPVAVALYERVKERRRCLDQTDLLLKLRDLLRSDRAVRREFQAMFDHVFVDEFQDTDPLQAEIVLFLCERDAVAPEARDVVLASGKLTLVGDPKQSIYRFRRADVAMYDEVRARVAAAGCREATLSTNFRSGGPLIAWINHRFDDLLGTKPEGGRPFDAATGETYYQPLQAWRDGAAHGAPVHVLRVACEARAKVDVVRAREGEAVARYLRWLVRSEATVADPLDGQRRGIRYGDVAILAVSTGRLHHLFRALDACDVPYASRGGTLFLSDPLHRQFMLGLRAVADRDDGVAQAALLRPPFFALDAADLLRERAGDADSAGGARVRGAVEVVRSLRRRRGEVGPGVTARDLLERTAFARTVALESNGAQRLARLRELCHALERLAADEGLDYDAATARMRTWLEAPVKLDPPPVGSEAVQVLTVHQAKGLEFPVVILWDARAELKTRGRAGAWLVRRDGAWRVDLDGLGWEEPADGGLDATEKAYLDAERKRLVYVAATRARDLLVVPDAGGDRRYVCGMLLEARPEGLIQEIDAAALSNEAPAPAPAAADDVEAAVAARWDAARTAAMRPHGRPISVTDVAHADETPPPRREGRFGSRFGTTVHEAIGMLLRRPRMPMEEAVRRAAARAGLDRNLEQAVVDVSRAMDALAMEGLQRPPGADLQVEYAVAAPQGDGCLLEGYVDLVSVTEGRVDVIDFKTDAPPRGAVERVCPQYVAQVRAYGRLLAEAGLVGARALRCGLLFTADGTIRWVP